MNSTEGVKAALEMVIAVGQAIRDLGEVPSGELYSQICHRVTLGEYNAMINALVRAGLVRNRGHLLVWVGPVPDRKTPSTIGWV